MLPARVGQTRIRRAQVERGRRRAPRRTVRREARRNRRVRLRVTGGDARLRADQGGEARRRVADETHRVAAGQRRRRRGAKGRRAAMREALRVNLPAARVDGGDHRPPRRVFRRRGQDLERGQADQRCRAGQREAARRGEADAHPREGAGSARHGDRIEPGAIETGLGQHRRDEGQQRFGVTARASLAPRRHDPPLRPQRRRTGGQRAVDGQDFRQRRLPSDWPAMLLVSVTPESHGVELALAYATADNFTGAAIYGRAACFLHPAAADALARAARAAGELGLRLRIFDAYRPTEAQWVLWRHTPCAEFLADPRRGSPHSRGAAIDLTLVDGDGEALDMGCGFDDFTARAHHAAAGLGAAARRNRLLLLGVMTEAGWDFYRNEWWHYQLFDARACPLLSDSAAATRLMPRSA